MTPRSMVWSLGRHAFPIVNATPCTLGRRATCAAGSEGSLIAALAPDSSLHTRTRRLTRMAIRAETISATISATISSRRLLPNQTVSSDGDGVGHRVGGTAVLGGVETGDLLLRRDAQDAEHLERAEEEDGEADNPRDLEAEGNELREEELATCPRHEETRVGDSRRRVGVCFVAKETDGE